MARYRPESCVCCAPEASAWCFNPKVPQIEQSDHDLTSLLLDQAVKDNGDTFAAGYV
jgi:hypothetical protein